MLSCAVLLLQARRFFLPVTLVPTALQSRSHRRIITQAADLLDSRAQHEEKLE